MVPQPKLLLDSLTGSGNATAGGTFTSGNIDTLGVDQVTIAIIASTQAATTQAGGPSVLKLQESDSTVAASFQDVPNARGGTALGANVDFVIGAGKTAGSNTYQMNVDCRARRRFLNVVAVPSVAQTFQVTAMGFRAEQSPATAAKAGVLNLIEL